MKYFSKKDIYALILAFPLLGAIFQIATHNPFIPSFDYFFFGGIISALYPCFICWLILTLNRQHIRKHPLASLEYKLSRQRSKALKKMPKSKILRTCAYAFGFYLSIIITYTSIVEIPGYYYTKNYGEPYHSILLLKAKSDIGHTSLKCRKKSEISVLGYNFTTPFNKFYVTKDVNKMKYFPVVIRIYGNKTMLGRTIEKYEIGRIIKPTEIQSNPIVTGES